jgi:penicillin-binding protein 1B
MRKLPSAPLALAQDGSDMVWVDPQSGARTGEKCPGARQVPVMAGFAPPESDSCPWYELKSVLGAGR